MSSIKIGIIGSGPAGLVTAHTLLKDGFDVQIMTRDSTAGGVWAAERVYPGVALNTPHGQFNFSSLPMPPSKHAEATGRLGGEDLRAYMESYAEHFLKGRIRFHTDVLNISRPRKEFDAEPAGWVITVRDTKTGVQDKLFFDKIVVCTGGYSEANIPKHLAVESQKFNGSLSHSSQFREKLPEILATVRPITDDKPGHIVIVGGGKSAQDISAYLANQGRRVSVVFESTDAPVARPKQLPGSLRKSRWVSVFLPHQKFRTRLERFLHTTWLGKMIVRTFWNNLVNVTWKTLRIPEDSPLRNARTLYWGLTQNDEGIGLPTSFHAMVYKGKIDLVAPTKVVEFGTDGRSVITADGRILEADAVIMCTGFHSSWNKVFDKQTIEEIGLERQSISPEIRAAADRRWNYRTLENPAVINKDPDFKCPLFYRGIIPAKSILRKDFAVNGGFFTTNNGYAFELASHWISSYFLSDEFLRLPSSQEQALEEAQMDAAWMLKRNPDTRHWPSHSCGCILVNQAWPHFCDDLYEDMQLPNQLQRLGGSWYNWMFKVVEVDEVKHLTEERRAKRTQFS